MSLITHMMREAKTRFYQAFANKPHPIELDKAIISISFDDVPLSAFENGLPILDRHSVKATFYIATGLSAEDASGHRENDGKNRFLTSAEIEQLDRSGHHIACHTYSHYVLEQGTAEQMEQDAVKNIQALSNMIGGKPIEHFSYPFGQVSFKAKQLLSKHYKTMRSSRPGVNLKSTDLYLLRATSIYHPTFSESSIKKAIDAAVSSGGWLVFYTHGVEGHPGRYDCTPEQLDWVISESVKSDAHILPVADSYNLITNS